MYNTSTYYSIDTVNVGEKDYLTQINSESLSCTWTLKAISVGMI